MVTLRVAFLGEVDSTFPVAIDEGEDAHELKELIQAKFSTEILRDARLIQLYLTKTHGNWMTGDEAAAVRDTSGLTLLRPQARLRRVGLAEADLANDGDDDVVHVLAVVPACLSARVAPDEARCTAAIASYRATAERLKDSMEVESLSQQLENVVSHSIRTPFVVLENSSGMGKTQMAFNLEAQGKWDVFYLPCCDTGDQGVYGAYAQRMRTFEACIRRDVETLERGMFYWRNVQLGGLGMIQSFKMLASYGFVITALRGEDTFGGAATRSDVEKELKLRHERGAKPIVFFLDEFPRIRRQHTSLLDKDQWKSESVPRMMRNVFRSFGLAVVVSGRSETGRKLFAVSEGDLRAGPFPWCVVVSSLPRVVVTENVDEVPTLVKRIINHSRPLFAQMAIQYVRDHTYSGKESTLAVYLDAMACSLAPLFASLKDDKSAEFKAGQLGLLLHSSSLSPAIVSDDVDLIDGHFARLLETTPIELTLIGDGVMWTDGEFWTGGSYWKNGNPWACHCVLPSPEEDLLLPLTLTGGLSFRPFKERLHRLLSSTIPRSDAEYLVSLTASAIVVASHIGGFGGVAFPLFVRELLIEFGITARHEESDKLTLPEKIGGWASVVVPFLSPANAPWPAWLQDSSTRFDSLTQQDVGDDLVQFRTASNAISVDCVMIEKTPLDPRGMHRILKKLPVESTTHLVVVHSLQRWYFTPKKSWATFVAEHPQLQHVGFYRVGKGARLREVAGMRNRGSEAKTLVLFIEIG